MALGAVQGDVVRLVLRQGLTLVVAGTAIGLGAALLMTRFLTRLIPSAAAGDPLTLSTVSALLLGVAFVAAYVPARRASRVDPIVALRYE
jgi:putative ABC transport system permease protein